MYKFLIKNRNAIKRLLLLVALLGALFAKGEVLRSFFLGVGIASGVFTFAEMIPRFRRSHSVEEIKH
ncbi:MAG: hypothetical protein KGM98_12790 [Bacteroidota bacterium]|nr:hypothetical protein [Bacteroidota bacterium]